MNKFLVLGLLIGCVLLLGCAQTPPQTPSPQPSSAVTLTPAPTASVSILDGSVNPETLEVKKGSVVVFTNNGKTAHDVIFEEEESAVLAPSESFSKLFAQTGDYYYSCSIHYGLESGVIKVS